MRSDRGRPDRRPDPDPPVPDTRPSVADVQPIDDLTDPRLADFADLRYPSVRAAVERERGIFTVEGRFALEALVASPHRTRACLVDARRVEALAPLLAATGAPCFVAPAALIGAVAGFTFHRGVLAVAERPAPVSAGEVVAGTRRLLVLEAVNDHENLGALFRNAAAFGVDAVVLDPTTADPLYRRSIRVSVGHVLRTPFARVPERSWPGWLTDLGAGGWEVVALTPDDGAEPLAALAGAPPEQVALVVGAEGPGLSAAAMAATTRRVRIPMAPGVDSINVATAAAIALSALYSW